MDSRAWQEVEHQIVESVVSAGSISACSWHCHWALELLEETQDDRKSCRIMEQEDWTGKADARLTLE